MSCSGSHEARRYTYRARRSDNEGNVSVSRSLKGTTKTQGARTGSHALGDWSEDLVESLKGYITECVAEDTCETKGCMRRSVVGHVASCG